MKFRHHKYTWSKPFTSVSHKWELVGPAGAIHLHVSLHSNEDDLAKYGPSCGLEFHHTRAAWAKRYGRDEAPHHMKCPLLGEPCWHDGTSLYAAETIWPIVQPMLKSGDHETIFRVLEREYERHFEPREE